MMMIAKVVIEQFVADGAALEKFQGDALAAFPDAQIRGVTGDYFRLGRAKAAEEAQRQVVVREALLPVVRAELTPIIAAEQEPIVIEKIVRGVIRDPRIQVVAEAEPIGEVP